MASQVHHVSCATRDAGAVSRFLRDVVGLSLFDEFNSPSEVSAPMFGWPAHTADTPGARYGAGPNGLVEVMTIPPELDGDAPEGLAFITFTTRDLAEALRRCRDLGFDVGQVKSFSPNPRVTLHAAVVRVGGVPFELAQYDVTTP